ncbi:MAG: FAD-binding oxidoreductase, partial [Actinomycetes bacterium]
MTTGVVVGRERRLISGWGRTAILSADVAMPESVDAVVDLVNDSPLIVPRGLGRSYGDCAQLSGGVALDMNFLDRITAFDPSSGVVDVEAGVSLDHLMRVLVPQGWFVPVTPGTRFVTIGGAIASDIHGKNHHHDGTFGEHLVDMTIVTGEGEVRTVSPAVSPEVFWATVGGMGLTGVIVSARLRMMPIESSKISSVGVRVRNLDELIEKMFEVDKAAQYSVAWVDCLARGKSFGRGVLMYGDHATEKQVGHRADRWDFGA